MTQVAMHHIRMQCFDGLGNIVCSTIRASGHESKTARRNGIWAETREGPPPLMIDIVFGALLNRSHWIDDHEDRRLPLRVGRALEPIGRQHACVETAHLPHLVLNLSSL